MYACTASSAQSLLNFKINDSCVQQFEGVDYSAEAQRAREKEILRMQRMELVQDVRVLCGVLPTG